jgi:hypothetical protein
MKRIAIFSLLILTLSALASVSAIAQEAMVPSAFRIKDIKSSGDACRAGTVSVNVSDDREAFTVSFADFVAEKGPNATGERRRACRLVFDTEQDANWEYAVLSVNMRGFVQLEAGVTGRQETQFGTRGVETDNVREFVGPIEEDYVTSQSTNISSVRWSGCRANASDRVRDFVVKATAVLRGGGAKASGLLTVDTIDGQLEQVYELLWRRCGDKGPKFVASCQVTGNRGNTISVKGMGRNAEAAKAKALSRLAPRCVNVKGRMGKCDQSLAQCSVTSF